MRKVGVQMFKLRNFVRLLLLLVILIPVGTFALTGSILSDIHNPDINTTSLDDKSHTYKDGIKNILVMGTDARPGETTSRADSMMIVTIDSVHDDIKITSLARDTLVTIPGHGKSKLTHAYAYGKEDLLIRTVENNFDIDIDEFVKINFQSFMAIIDSIGGVTVDVTQNELAELNKFIPETYSWSTNKNKGEMELVKSAGTQKLNGYQALSYARIRHNDSAFGRDNRQRMIVSSIMKEVKNTSILKYPLLLKAAAPYIDSSMSPTKMIKLGLEALKIGTDNIKQKEFPLVDNPRYTTNGSYLNYGWVIRYYPDSVKFLKQFIFDDIEY